jgi:hypothetical protein
MEKSDDRRLKAGQVSAVPDDVSGAVSLTGEDEFNSGFGEPLAKALDLNTWSRGEDLADLYGRLENEVAAAVEQENSVRPRLRELVFPRIRTRDGAPTGAGSMWRRLIRSRESTEGSCSTARSKHAMGPVFPSIRYR